tara:strand:+ start:9396 stop:9944 length:549 start_codon:yes stop_codon:yes gene_type:complete
MTVNVNIKLDPRIELKARRTLSGDIMILDHEDMDIVLMLEKKKCVTFPKSEFSDKSYVAQDRMMSFLAKKGLIDRGSVVGGNVFGSLEAKMLESKVEGIDQTQALLFSIEEYITGEKKFFRQSKDYDDARLDAMLRPAPDDSTELGDVPQAAEKGSMSARVRPYGFQYNYSLVREGKESEDS